MSHDIDSQRTKEKPRLSGPDDPTILVFGLGYVGLPLAAAFSQEGYDTRGYDIDRQKIRQLKGGSDPTGEVGDAIIEDCEISYCDNVSAVGKSDYVLVTVPTPIDEFEEPDTRLVSAAGRDIGEFLTKGTTVVLESTVYPGVTREVFLPALEETSNLTAGQDFWVAYSPERIDPGKSGPGLRDAVKVVSGQDDATREDVADLYRSVIDAGIYRAPSIETAEAAKCIENAQRDLNIAFVNELAMACHRTDLDIDASDVLDAAGTKWNFHEYSPGLVGGHCIPVDPYYLIFAFEKDGFSPTLMRTAREVNERVPSCVAEMTADMLKRRDRSISEPAKSGSKDGGHLEERAAVTGESYRRDDFETRPDVLVLGLTYKANTKDVRSPVLHRLLDDLREYGLDPTGFDPHADHEVTRSTFDVPIQEELTVDGFDALVVSTPHDEFAELDLETVEEEMADDPVIVDVSGAFDRAEASDHGFAYERL